MSTDAKPKPDKNYERVIIFANGKFEEGAAEQAVLAEAETAVLVAADGGANLAARLGYDVTLLLGDMDSIKPQTLDNLIAAGIEILSFPPEKDQTDLEIALLEVAARGARWVRIIGALGGRLDQSLANVYLLGLSALAEIDVRMVAGDQTVWELLPGDHPLMGVAGDTISLLPLGGDVQGIRTQDLQYPLKGETLAFGPARGISNIVSGAAPRLGFESGRLLVIHTLGRA